MSIKRMEQVFDIKFPTLAAKLVALRLADYSSKDGFQIFPAVATLADAAQIDHRTAQRVLSMFRSCGLLQVTHEGGSRPGDTNQYWLNVDMLDALEIGTVSLIGNSRELHVEGEYRGGDVEAARQAANDGRPQATPTPKTGGQRPPLRVVCDTHMGGPRTTQPVKEPSNKSAGAHEASELPRASRAACHTLPTDAQWPMWLEHLQPLGLADEAIRIGRVVADSRIPRNATVIFEPSKKGLSDGSQDLAARIIGEANDA